MKYFASIIVITYNSSDYILETLESIEKQKFTDFEVIICDDGSSDGTVEVCQSWMSSNSHLAVKLLADGLNRGIPGNCNKGLYIAKGEWIKLIAGDDLLHPNCLSALYEEYFQSQCSLYVGRFEKFFMDDNIKVSKGLFPTEKQLAFFHLSADKQLKKLLTESFNFSPAVFIKKKLFDQYGFFDERFKLLEDLPYWIKLTECGVKFNLINSMVVWYRTNHESTVFTQENFYNKRFMDGLYEFRKMELYKRIPKSDIVFYQAELMERINYWVIIKLFNNKKNILSKFVSKAILFPTFKRFLKLITYK